MTSSLFGSRARAAAIVFACALAVRLGHLARTGVPTELKADAGEYHAYALNLAEHGRFEGPGGLRGSRMPGYPAFLAVVYSLGGGVRAAVVAQSVLGAAGAALVCLTAWTLLPPAWALGAGLAAATYLGLIDPCVLLLSECLYSFLLSLALFFLYKDGSPAPRAALFGAALGATYLVRPELLPYALACAAALPYCLKGFGRRESALAAGVFALFVAGWTARNYAVLGAPLPATSSSGSVRYMTLYLAKLSKGEEPGPVFVPEPGLPELERERSFARAAEALDGGGTFARRLKNYAYNIVAMYYPFLPAYDVTFMLLAPFWVYGLFAALGRPELWPLAGPIPFSVAVFTFLGGPASRYRQGIAPCLVLLGVWGLFRLRERFPALWPRAVSSWAVLNLAVWLFAPQVRAGALAVKDLLWR